MGVIGHGLAFNVDNMSIRHLASLTTVPLFFLIILMHTGGCDRDEALEINHATNFTRQEQAVYSVILSQFLLSEYFSNSSFVLMNETQAWNEDAVVPYEEDEKPWIVQKFGDISNELLQSLQKANRQSSVLPNDLTLGAPYHLLDQIALKAIVNSGRSKSNGFWNGLVTQFPDSAGIFTIAHVGFDDSEHHALAYLEWYAGPLASWHRYYFLERQGDTWTIVDDLITLIS